MRPSEIPSDLRDPRGGVVAPQPVSQFDDTDRSEPLDTDQQGEQSSIERDAGSFYESARCFLPHLFLQEFDDRIDRLPAVFLKNHHVCTLTDLDPPPIGRSG